MIVAALLGMLLHAGGGVDPVMVPLTLVSGVDSAALVAVPLFVLAGEIMNHGGLTRRLIDWASAMVGHFRGSLSQVSMMTNLVMAGISGSAVADATATGSLLIPAMKKEGYKPGYAAAVIAAGAMLGPILPPSIPMIVYAVIANVSIAKLFLAGIVPGLMLFFGYVAICAWIARRRDYRAKPRAPLREQLAQHPRRHLGADGADPDPGRHPLGRDHRNRGGGRHLRLRAAGRALHLPRPEAARPRRGLLFGRQDIGGDPVPACRGRTVRMADERVAHRHADFAVRSLDSRAIRWWCCWW